VTDPRLGSGANDKSLSFVPLSLKFQLKIEADYKLCGTGAS